MLELLKRNYEATKIRGQITDKSTVTDFIKKIDEEVAELKASYKFFSDGSEDFDYTECVDVMLVCSSLLLHFNISEYYGIETYIRVKVEYNENRALDAVEEAIEGIESSGGGNLDIVLAYAKAQLSLSRSRVNDK